MSLVEKTPLRRRKASSVGGIIVSADDIRAGVLSLRRKCSVIRHCHALAGDPPLRRREAGFEGLARIVVGQQLSVASAEAIWARTATLVAPFRADVLLALSDAELRAAGLSSGKVKTLRAAAAAVVAGDLDFTRVGAASEDDAKAELTAVTGVGPWTADIYRLFCLGHRDAFAPGDLALQIAVQLAMKLDARPNAAEIAEIAERWRPWRGVAAHLLWAYYKAAKDQRSGVPV